MAENDILYCFRLEDVSGEFEPASSLLDALELQYSSYFERGNMTVVHTVYAETEAEAQAALDKINTMLPDWKRDMEI